MDRFHNSFARPAWPVNDLARHAAPSAVTRLKVLGPFYLVVDDSLLHQRGRKVFGIGWSRDAGRPAEGNRGSGRRRP